ncbi:hypothetical protein TeGR_g10039 [Tetraparma gracilis]|uniref:Uncharacterized protein n=1 Tax=Tetraparma gracilis TaxID=2962635 RepID=A0ABQ6MWJ2_9STRA|nr:hypothetical protein TeGR_g10039 [Tetraparma gracilis]
MPSAFDVALADQRKSLAAPSDPSKVPFTLTPANRASPSSTLTLSVYETQVFSRFSLKWSTPSLPSNESKLLASKQLKRPKYVPRFHSPSCDPSIPIDEIDPPPGYTSAGNWRLKMNVVNSAKHVYGDGWEYSSSYASLLSGYKANGKKRSPRFEGRMRDVYRRRDTVTELENNMIESHETTKAAVADLEEAAKYQRSSQCLIQ